MLFDLSILIFTVGINSALIVLILLKNRTPVQNKIFIAFILGVLSWIITNYFADHSLNNGQALFWSQIIWIISPLVLLCAILFVLYFPYQDVQIKRKILISFFITGFFSILCAINFSLFIKDVRIGNQGIDHINYGPYFTSGLIFFSLLIIYTIVKFFIKYRKVNGFEKLQSKYFLLGWSLFLFSVAIFSLLLPFLTQNALLSKLPPIFSLFFTGMTTYAIVRHRLMDIRIFIQKTILYAISFCLFFIIYLSLIFIFNQVFAALDLAPTMSSIICAILGIAFYPRFKLYFQRVTDRFFYRYPYNANRVLKELHEKCGRQTDFDNFFICLTTIVESRLKINKILLAVIQKGERPFLVKNHNFSRKLSDFLKTTECPPIIYEFLNQHRCPILMTENYPELEFQMKDLNLQHDLFIKCGIEVILPIYRKDKLAALIFLGSKISQENYYPQDLQLFETLINTLGMAVENIFLYNDLKQALIGMEEKVNQRTKELQELNANQSRFMADISHELQTPLAILKGNLSLLNQQKMSQAETRKYYLHMERSIDRLSHLMKDLIFLSKADAGKINIKKEYVNLSNLVQKASDDSLILAEDKGIGLETNIEKNIWLFGDQDTIQSLLFNLISNALKYTGPNKQVVIKLLKESDRAHLIVEDQGIGIAPENLPHIFSRFYRIEQLGKEKGTGLGLAICKWIVQSHDGKIEIKSQLGHGTTIIVDLPCKLV
ncbi:MAG: ATP-binding protein [Candidatus Parcubacteria bacterium]|nr:ATP-binding protein [Candidatus Parcubacteria bacterium]